MCWEMGKRLDNLYYEILFFPSLFFLGGSMSMYTVFWLVGTDAYKQKHNLSLIFSIPYCPTSETLWGLMEMCDFAIALGCAVSMQEDNP